MTTITMPQRAFSLFSSPTLLLGFVCVLVPAFAGAEQLVTPATQVKMNEAPPPWQGNSPLTQSAPASPSAPAVEQAASGGSSVESWYRNRRKVAVTPANEQAALQAAAQKGDAKAQYDLGLLYANGQYVAADPEQARNWFQQAADQGHVAARLALVSLNNGASAQAIASAPVMKEVQQEVIAAAPPVLRPQAMAPVVDSASYPEPVTTKVSLSEPEPAPNSDTSNENSSASGNVDLTGIEPEVLRQSAEAGDKQAQLMLGTLYEDGLGGLPSDLRDAAYWYEQAAKQGYPKAQYNLGLLYEDGRGVTQNYTQAAFWYDKAAKAGFTEAQNNLGVLYVLGNGVKKDAKKAEQLFSEATRSGNSDAQRNLDMLRKG